MIFLHLLDGFAICHYLIRTLENQSIKLYSRYDFIKNALPVSCLYNKIFKETTLMLKICLYIKKIYPIINYTKINLKCTIYNENKCYLNSLKAIPGSRQRQGRLEKLRFISSLSTFSRPFHITAPLSIKARLAASVQGLGLKVLFEAPRTL